MNKNTRKVNFGMGVYLPEKELTNEELERRRIILSNGKQLRAIRILEKIGVERRHIAKESETVADMGYEASKKALYIQGKGVMHYAPTKNIDLILASSSHTTPFNVAVEIKKKLGTEDTEIMDFHAACSGTALMFAYLFENKEKYSGKNVLLVSADKFSNSIVDLTRDDAMLLDSSLGQTIFGDGAAAVFFNFGKDITVHYAVSKPIPDPGGKTDLILMGMGKNKFVEPCIVKPVAASPIHKDFPNGYFSQNGPKVFEIVYNSIPAIIRETVKKAGFKAKDIDLVVIHPGSKRVVEALRDALKPDFEVYSDYAEGNMSSVSLLYSFIKAIKDGKIGKGSKVVLSGFGAGSPDLYSSTVVVEL